MFRVTCHEIVRHPKQKQYKEQNVFGMSEKGYALKRKLSLPDVNFD